MQFAGNLSNSGYELLLSDPVTLATWQGPCFGTACGAASEDANDLIRCTTSIRSELHSSDFACTASMARASSLASVLICCCLVFCNGQGLDENPKSLLGASNAQARLDVVYQGSRAWRNAYLSRPSVCSKSSGSLCASGGLSTEQRVGVPPRLWA